MEKPEYVLRPEVKEAANTFFVLFGASSLVVDVFMLLHYLLEYLKM